ncbi:hypothetical protein [Microvirga sp. VF16]|uniref:hypothetical protein n=1 Tax=Microvirga sp. VF16 TaxID=2807101 RepID=UPI00193CEAC1|nr:hypothetical protein [Microvirga sp. VF16]QRM31339.1 hypothetical protein JO965_10310 [Microvirga sp. VF16]
MARWYLRWAARSAACVAPMAAVVSVRFAVVTVRPEEDHLPALRIRAGQAGLAGFQEVQAERLVLSQEQTRPH